MSETSIVAKLIAIQRDLKAPKGQYNNFGKYAYRSAEDILEAVKPLCHAQGCYLCIADEIVYVEGRHYIKATAEIMSEDGAKIRASAYAREAAEKKGMDEAQITGSASSYARKYALNGLFCIDDTKDPDATNDHGKSSTLLAGYMEVFAAVEGCKSKNEIDTVTAQYGEAFKSFTVTEQSAIKNLKRKKLEEING